MSSIPGLPTPGSHVTILITRVHLHPLCVLVEFWGKFSQDRTTDYELLAKDIQSPGTTFRDLEGSPGDKCLVQIDDTWYRSRIVSRNGSRYSVFLIDKGMTYTATKSMLAWGKKEHFELLPEVEFCVLANVVPLSLENRWSAVALEFLKTLTGKSVAVHVQDILVPHRMFLLHIPSVSQQMYEMGFAKKVSPDSFQDFVLTLLNSQGGAETSLDIQQLSKPTGQLLLKEELFMYPELPGGTVENVVITEVTNPQRIFCQLKVFSQELKKLSDQLTQTCEGRVSGWVMGPEMIGSPCAARGSDRRWYRSVLQQVFSQNKMVEVLNVDYGTKQLVQVENIQPLAAEFFRMPVVTYICSLHGLIDKGVGWTASQIDFLRSLLLYKRMIAKFEYQSISEGVYYVTLYDDDNTNMNNLFGSRESCLLEFDKTLGDYAVCGSLYNHHHPSQEKQMEAPGQALKEKGSKPAAHAPPVEDLSLNSSHMAVVHHVSSPSEFWIQTETYRKELDELLDSIGHLYQDSANTNVVRNPIVGLHCAAKAEDGEFYRAAVTEVSETQVKVFFYDYGNTEVVDRSNIRTLPSEFQKLPQLALKCSLASVRPKAGKWSQSASEVFIQTVADKVLDVDVKAKCNDGYVIELKDPEAQGEKDVGTLMCIYGFAERAEMQTRPKVKCAPQAAIVCSTQPSESRMSGEHGKSGFSLQTQILHAPPDGNRRVATFKEHMFPIGRVLDVGVSCIESPNDFWCQQVQNASHLKLLMDDMQAYYTGSEFQPNVEVACVARHPDNRMWYRALVVTKHKTPHVDTLFVDYGQTLTVSIYDLRRICPDFLSLPGQAFRCSLLNPINPTSVGNEWSEDAKAKFKNFVETAASNFVVLKCTIYAVMYSEQMVVYNIVDLETPFESICTSVANLGLSASPKNASRTPFRLNTYYYSTHNVKTGTEEQVTVTYVNGVNQFYCHLDKNTDVMKDLQMKVSTLCHQLEKLKLPPVFGTLCFARYTDGEWYRAQIKTTTPTILVHFVDYGDTIEVDKSDLLPVPKDANYIMSVPVQAVTCGLSDVPAHVPDEVNSWFQTMAPELAFRALIVAREPDGKLLVELYHKNTQINAKIKKMFQIEMKTEQRVVYQGKQALEASASCAQKTAKPLSKQAADTEDHKQDLKKNQFPPSKPPLQMRVEKKMTDANQQFEQRPGRHVAENGHRIKPTPVELYKPPQQRQRYGSEPADAQMKPRRENHPPDTKQPKSKPPGMVSQKENDADKLPKLADLPSKSIPSGTTVDVYVSHCNSPASFYVQCVNEEEELFSLTEKLNDPKLVPEVCGLKDVNPGDLIQAEYAEDSSWYRAVVKEIQDNAAAVVQYVDFGNTAVTSFSKMARLHKSLMGCPVYSTHCMLSDAAAIGKEKALNPDVVSSFKRDIGGCGEKLLRCLFIRQVGSVWEVRLEDGGVDVVCKVPAGEPQITTVEEEAEESRPKLRSLCYTHQQEFLEGQQLEVYITAINDAQSFWCQSTNTEELDKITASVSEIGNGAGKCIKPDDLLPGIPCIALFSDDQLWYRTEVISKDGDQLTVLFVDYGNTSMVGITDVREMPPVLVDIPPQAFLCELHGFDSPQGSWDSGAADELSTLTEDKLLQLTVMRIARAEGKIKCLVQIESEGQVINEVMKTWWKCVPAFGSISSSEKLQPDPPAAAGDDQLEQPDIRDIDHHTEENNSNLASSPKHSESSEDFFTVESPKEGLSTEEKLMSPKDVLPTEDGIDKSLLLPLGNKGEEILPLSCNINEDTVEGNKDLDSPLEESVETIDESETDKADKEEMNPSTCSLDIKALSVEGQVKVEDDGKAAVSGGTSVTAATAVKMAESEHPSPVHPEQQFCETFTDQEDVLCAPTQDPFHNDSESEVAASGHHADTSSDTEAATSEPNSSAVSSPQKDDEVGELTCCAEETHSADVRSDLVEPVVEEKITSTEAACLSHVTTEEMTTCIEAESEDPSPVLPEQQFCETVTDQEDMLCAPTQDPFHNDSESKVAASGHHDDTFLDTEAATSEPNGSTVSFPEKDDEVGELTCCAEETHSADVRSDLVEPIVEEKITSTKAACLSHVTTEEMATCIEAESEHPSPVCPEQQFCDSPTDQEDVLCAPTQDPFHNDSEGEVAASGHHDDSSSDTEAATSELNGSTVSFPEKDDEVGELTCCAEETHSTDVCTDLEEPSVDGKLTSTGAACLSHVTAEEMMTCIKISQEDVCLEVEDDLCEVSTVETNEVQNESVESPMGSTGKLREVVGQDDESLTSSTEEENSSTEDESSSLHEEKCSALQADTEPQTTPDLSNLVEELSSLVRDIHLTDVCQAESISEDCEQQLHTPPQNQEHKEKDSDSSVLTEEEDSFEAQLSKITHLSLIIRDGSDDDLRPGQQSEE